MLFVLPLVEPNSEDTCALKVYFGSLRIESESIYALVDSADGSVSVLMALPCVPAIGVRCAFALPDSSWLLRPDPNTIPLNH
jgi:hypothetical protein